MEFYPLHALDKTRIFEYNGVSRIAYSKQVEKECGLMAENELSFGEFLTQLREEKDVTMRELARKIGVSAPFLSDVEKNRRAPLTAERLEKVATVLGLSEAEKAEMYDLAGKQRNTIAPDLPEYIMEHDYVSAALRTARDLDAGEAEWKEFIEKLKKGKSY